MAAQGSAPSSTITGSAPAPARIAGADGRDFLERLDPPADARERVIVALFMVSTLDRQIREVQRGRRRLACPQADCLAQLTWFWVEELIALTFRPELGDAGRMTSFRKAVRFADGTSAGIAAASGGTPAKADRSCAGRGVRLRNPRLAARARLRPLHALRAMIHPGASLTIAARSPGAGYHLLSNLGPDALASLTLTGFPSAPASPLPRRFGPCPASSQASAAPIRVVLTVTERSDAHGTGR